MKEVYPTILGNNVVTVKVGSWLFGTNRDSSDHDFITIYKPPLGDLVLLKSEQPSQKVDYDAAGIKIETTRWSLQHFFKLLAQGQTQALELVFAPSHHMYYGDFKKHDNLYWGEFLRDFYSNKEKFISKNTAAFVGYCRSQANKYSVKGERLRAVETLLKYIDNAYNYRYTDHIKVKDIPELVVNIENYGLPYLNMVPIRSQNTDIMHIYCCSVACPVHFTLKQAKDMYQRLSDEYGKRAQNAKDNENHDWKALSHAVRVAIEAKELLKDKVITLPLKQADWVKEVKEGKVPYQDVVEFIDTSLQEIEALQVVSTLSEKPDYEHINYWIKRAYVGDSVNLSA